MTPQDIVELTARENSISRWRLWPTGHRTTQRVSLIRMQVARRLRGRGLSYQEIGEAMGGFNHTSVMSMLWGGKTKKRR